MKGPQSVPRSCGRLRGSPQGWPREGMKKGALSREGEKPTFPWGRGVGIVLDSEDTHFAKMSLPDLYIK